MYKFLYNYTHTIFDLYSLKEFIYLDLITLYMSIYRKYLYNLHLHLNIYKNTSNYICKNRLLWIQGKADR